MGAVYASPATFLDFRSFLSFQGTAAEAKAAGPAQPESSKDMPEETTAPVAGWTRTEELVSKVPAVTLGFWIIKILATTLGETGGDTITMTWLGETTNAATGYGYLLGTALVSVPFVTLVIVQIAAKKFHPFVYWATIVASTMLGTTLADFADRSLGMGYTGGATVLLACVLAVLALWYWSEGTVSVDTVNTPKVEMFYWATITFSQTLGTALGDWMADDAGVGFLGGALVFGAALAI